LTKKRNFRKIEGTDNFWAPAKEGEIIEGDVLDIISGSFGNQHILKLDDKTTIMTPSHKILQSKLAQVKIGDYVRITYVDETESTKKGHSPTKNYEVEVEEIE